LNPAEKLVEVDPDLILGPGSGIFATGPLVQRALSMADTKEVKTQLEYLLTDKRKDIRRALSLSTIFLEHITPILKDNGLPSELAFLCIIESGYHQSARSHAGAVGMWQMIRATSRRFDLVTNNWVDDRLDFVKSTEGAARFLGYLKERFDDWDHVLAAYNAGEGRVMKAIKRAERLRLDPVFSNLRLPRETRIYVPAFYASLLIALEPERYGLFPDYQPPLDFIEIKIPGGVPLATVSRHMRCEMDSLRSLNPSILKDRVPFVEGGFPLRIPCSVRPDQARTVAASLNEIQYVSYRVRRGDTLWDISRKFGVSMSRISRAGKNRGNLSRIFPGEILLVALTGEAS
jgi:membrane-bound lytic murein transglycosylase D